MERFQAFGLPAKPPNAPENQPLPHFLSSNCRLIGRITGVCYLIAALVFTDADLPHSGRTPAVIESKSLASRYSEELVPKHPWRFGKVENEMAATENEPRQNQGGPLQRGA
jgi:hypothetical protein